MTDGTPQDPTTLAEEVPSPADPRVNQELAQLREAIGRGMDLEGFMAGPLGKYMQLRASRELEDAQEALVEVDATDTARVQGLQLNARVAGRVLTWFADIAREAELAEQKHRVTFEQQQFPD